MQRYMVTGDRSMLDQIIQLVGSELSDPTLQKCVISLDSMTAYEANVKLAEEHYLKVPTTDFTDSDPIVVGKWVRVMAVDQQENTCMLLKVAHLDAKNILLVPPNRGGESPE